MGVWPSRRSRASVHSEASDGVGGWRVRRGVSLELRSVRRMEVVVGGGVEVEVEVWFRAVAAVGEREREDVEEEVEVERRRWV